MASGTSILRRVASVLPSRALRVFGRPMAFHFHGVERTIEDPNIQRNHHALDDFHRIAKSLKTDFQILPLAALGDVLKNPARHARTAFLMSDDGYRNTLTVAADVLDGLGLPWTLFVSTHHVDTGELNPATIARLFFYFAPAGTYTLPNLIGPIVLAGPETRGEAAARNAKRFLSLDLRRARETVDAMIGAIPAAGLAALKKRFASESFLNWPQVAELSKRGVEIGAHAHTHWPLHGSCAAADVVKEVRTAKERIENQIGPCRYFAYPFGHSSDVSRNAWRAVRDAGFTYGFTTLAGSLDAGSNPWLLPRYGLHDGERSLAALAPLLRTANPRLALWQKRLA